MSEIRVKVPEGMLKAAQVAQASSFYSEKPQSVGMIEAGLEAALRWLDGELERMLNNKPPEHSIRYREAISDVRRMFLAPPANPISVTLDEGIYRVERDGSYTRIEGGIDTAPEPEMPQEIKHLLWGPPGEYDLPSTAVHNNAILEAYRRGLERKTDDHSKP